MLSTLLMESRSRVLLMEHPHQTSNWSKQDFQRFGLFYDLFLCCGPGLKSAFTSHCLRSRHEFPCSICIWETHRTAWRIPISVSWATPHLDTQVQTLESLCGMHWCNLCAKCNRPHTLSGWVGDVKLDFTIVKMSLADLSPNYKRERYHQGLYKQGGLWICFLMCFKNRVSCI